MGNAEGSSTSVFGMLVINDTVVINVVTMEKYTYSFSANGIELTPSQVHDMVCRYMVDNVDTMNKLAGLASSLRSEGIEPQHMVYGYVLGKLASSGALDIVCDTVPVTREEIKSMVAGAVESEIDALSGILSMIKGGGDGGVSSRQVTGSST